MTPMNQFVFPRRFTIRTMILACSISSLILYTGCSGSSTNSILSSTYDTSTAGVVGSSIAGASSASDDSSSGTSVALTSPMKSRDSLFSVLMPKAFATSCILGVRIKGQTCSSSAITLTLGGCTSSDGYFAWTGSDTLTFGTSSACTSATTTGATGGIMNLTSGSTVTLTSAGGITRTNNTTGNLIVQTSASSGYNSAVSGGSTITCTGTTCAAGRTFNISGLQRLDYTSTSAQTSGSATYNHSLNTSTPFTITGTDAAGTKTISAGTLVLQHNLLKFTATSTVTTSLTFTSGCCFPTGGSMTTTFSGSKTGSETITFSSTCGTASVGGTSFSMTQCI